MSYEDPCDAWDRAYERQRDEQIDRVCQVCNEKRSASNGMCVACFVAVKGAK